MDSGLSMSSLRTFTSNAGLAAVDSENALFAVKIYYGFMLLPRKEFDA